MEQEYEGRGMMVKCKRRRRMIEVDETERTADLQLGLRLEDEKRE